MNDKKYNPWTIEDEKIHTESVIEWWCHEIFYKTIEDNKNWHLNASMSEYGKKNWCGSATKTTLYNLDSKDRYDYLKYTKKRYDKPKDVGFSVKEPNAFMRGLFPNYELKMRDPDHDIEVDIKCIAKAYPHWISQEVTNGWLPWGLGAYRYGFIPKLEITGTMKFNNKIQRIKGTSYFEHVYGNFNFKKPAEMLSGLKKTLSILVKLGDNWINKTKIKLPNTIEFTSENNPIGYDWAWNVFENGWTIFFGNIMLWISEGPGFGTLILSKDDKNYTEFSDIYFRYNKMKYSDNFDFYYPTEIKVIAKNNNELLHLTYKQTAEAREFIQILNGKYYKSFVICEAPGIVEGYYSDKEKKIPLKGFAKIEPQRQVSVFGHSKFRIDFLKPPKKFGIAFDFTSHYFLKNIKAKFQLAPKAKIKFDFKRLDGSKFHR
jgi:hypothetical protein